METHDRVSAVYEAMSPRRKTQSRSARLQQSREASRSYRAQRPDELFSPAHQAEPKYRTSSKSFTASNRRSGSGKSALRGSTPVSSPDRTAARLHGRSAMIPYSPLRSDGSAIDHLVGSAASKGLPEANSGLVAPGLASSRSAFNIAMGMSLAAGGIKYDLSSPVGQGLAVSHVHSDSIRVRTRNGSTVRPSWLHPDIQVLRNPFLGLKEFVVYGRRFGTAREAQVFWEYNAGISREDGALLGSDGYAGSVLGGSVLFAGSSRLDDSLGNFRGDGYEPIAEPDSVASRTDGASAEQRGVVAEGDGNLLAEESRGESEGIYTGNFAAPNDNPEGLGIAARRAVRELVAVLGPLAVTRHGLSPRASARATARRSPRKRQAMETPIGSHAGRSNRNSTGGKGARQPKKASPRRASGGKPTGGGSGRASEGGNGTPLAGNREPEDGLLSASGSARLAGLTTDESRAGAPLRGSRRAALERMGVRSHAAAASAYSPLRRSRHEGRGQGQERLNGVTSESNGAHAGRDGAGHGGASVGMMDSEQVRARLERIDLALEALLRSREQGNARVDNANEPVGSKEGGPVGEAPSEMGSSRSEPHARGPPPPPPEGYMPREQLERAIAALEAAAEQDRNYLLEQLRERESKVAALEQQLRRAHARIASDSVSGQEGDGSESGRSNPRHQTQVGSDAPPVPGGAVGSHGGQSAPARAAAPAYDEGTAVSGTASGFTTSGDAQQNGEIGSRGEARAPPPPPER